MIKQKWYSLFEGVKLPIGLLIIGYIFIGIGNYVTTDNSTLSSIIYTIQYCGVLLKKLFPLFLTIGISTRNTNSAFSVMSAIACYFTVSIVTMVLANQSFDSYFYDTTFGFSIKILNPSTNLYVTHLPINLGYIMPIVIASFIGLINKKLKKRTNYGVFSFVSNEVMSLILAVFVGIGLGAIASIIFPYFVKATETVLAYVAEYSTRVRGLFVYEVLERVLNISGYQDIISNAFWIGPAGGNWVDSLGLVHYGDINVWTAQAASNAIELGFGKYITPYYVFNLFAVPTICLVLFFQIKNPVEKEAKVGLLILAVVASILTSSLLPVEIMLLFVAPLLLGGHILISGLVCSILFKLNVQIGYCFTNDINLALPGNIIEFIKNQAYSMNENAWWILLVVGVVSAIMYVVFAIIYYKFLSIKIFSSKQRKNYINSIEQDLGGAINIEYISGGLMYLQIVVKNEKYVNFDNLIKKGFFNIKELRYGFQVGVGCGSNAIAKAIKKDVKEKENNSYIVE